jgi:hypothetical protein
MLPLLFLLAAGFKLEPTTLAEDLKGGYQVLAADLNKDGHTDLIALAQGLDHLPWFENPGKAGEPWKRHILTTGLRQPINVAALDTDKDGIPELLLAHEFSNVPSRSKGTVSLFRSGPDPRQPWSRQDIEDRPTSHRLRVANGAFVNAPLSHPTTMPPEYKGAVPVVEYAPPDFKPRVLFETESGVMHGLSVFDFNGDGREDIFTAAFTGISAHVREANGAYRRVFLNAGSLAPWPKSGSSEIALVRTNKKGDFILASIDPWHGNEFAIYETPRKNWRRTVLDSNFEEGHTLLPIDLDGDGTEEIVYGSRKQGGTLRIAELDKNAKTWKIRSLYDGKIGTASCAALDFDHDRRPDFACIGGASQNLILFRNEEK